MGSKKYNPNKSYEITDLQMKIMEELEENKKVDPDFVVKRLHVSLCEFYKMKLLFESGADYYTASEKNVSPVEEDNNGEMEEVICPTCGVDKPYFIKLIGKRPQRRRRVYCTKHENNRKG